MTDDFLKIATHAVKKAGQLLNDNIQKVEEVSFKSKSNIVTNIDLEAEKIILDSIKNNFPEHGILSEEADAVGDQSAEYLWIIDPIDGTINYYYGMNPFRVGACLLQNKKPILTVIYNPTKDELYTGEIGKGAFLNGKRIMVTDNDELENSVVMFHLSSKKDPRLRTLGLLDVIFQESMHMRMYGSSLAQMSYIASGKFDVYFNIETNPWDILPGALLVQEAGGKVTDIKGDAITNTSVSVVATNGKVHDKILALLRR
jgi:myo-inositol-1(or 4)-monophosphatase